MTGGAIAGSDQQDTVTTPYLAWNCFTRAVWLGNNTSDCQTCGVSTIVPSSHHFVIYFVTELKWSEVLVCLTFSYISRSTNCVSLIGHTLFAVM